MPIRDSSDVLLCPDQLWDGESDRAQTGLQVRTQGDEIVEVGADLRIGSATRVVPLPGLTLLPGFIDCHVHLIDDDLDTEPAGYQLLNAVPLLRTFLDHGFTTVRDLGSADGALNLALQKGVEEGLIPGPRMFVAPNLLSARGGHGDKTPALAQRYGLEVGTLADGADNLRRRVREQARSGADWIKFAAGGGFSSPADTPLHVGYTQQEMNALVATAADRGLPCAAHAFADEAVQRAVRAGVRSIEHACLAGAETLALLVEADTYLVPTQYAQFYYLDRLDDDAFWQDKSPDLRDAYRRHAPDLRARATLPAASGVTIAFGTDVGMFPHAQGWREFTTLVAHGLTPLRALQAATSTAAGLLQQSRLGHIAPGKAADLVATAGNPLTDIEATGRVQFVMTRGHLHRTPAELSSGRLSIPTPSRTGGTPLADVP
ncbi:metal-dependent hydrolase family protein [Streptomyces candidus]|uniref:Imidazolonepropionase-like amidohydrolase n=1 Tax=Streptomyces candidus TaxID=67283 RepID=A0A7X0HNM7_9ACTN|nr:amidohydrolase family protein [Streptomyces candidus]MBB6439493.1 imidazolonepropionase-like amidohydrolase [Streptomyces candidus]